MKSLSGKEGKMVNTIQANLVVENKKFCIIVSRFNEFIGKKLLDGAVDELVRHNTKESDIDVIWVPGAFEIPVVAQKAAKKGKYSAIIALGAIIRGAIIPTTTVIFIYIYEFIQIEYLR